MSQFPPATRPGPALLAPVQPVLAHILAGVLARHPDIPARLAGFDGRVVGIAPTDLPFALRLCLGGDSPTLRACPPADLAGASAVIRGDLATLAALAEGRADGDALFFSRRLVVEGDTEVVVALRNAIDGAGIDLVTDLTAGLGPFAPLGQRLARHALGVAGRLRAGLDHVRQALIAPALRANARHDRRIADLETQIQDLRRAGRGRRAAP